MSKILIVDDSPSAREALYAILEGQGYQLATAESGQQALELAADLHPDLILLDVMMPGMDGFEVCRRIRSNPQVAEVPIVILTALDDSASLLKGIEAGADDFLAKPVDRHELRARVRTITRLNRYHTLMEQRESLRRMAERVMQAQEQERLRLSRELHDDLGQALTANMLEIRNLQNDLTIPVAELFERLQALYQHTYETSVKIRQLAQDMRPPVLEALGLKDAIKTYCTEFTRRTGLPVELEIEETLPALPDLYNITLYRVLQEALNNIVKHAQANRVWVEMTTESHTLTLTVQDNGRGFEPGQNEKQGLGLAGMQERLTLAGGSFNLTSHLGRGTILAAALPINSREAL